LLALTAEARAAGAEVIEWRIDTCLAAGAVAAELIAAIPSSPLPVLWTIRHASESGSWQESIVAREALCAAADAAGAAYIDLELAQLGTWRPTRARLILSYHDFTGMGQDLPGKIAAMRAANGLPKIAVMARDGRDLAVIHDLLARRQGDLIALAMGEHGLPSRLLAGVWGGFLTFARLADQAGSAPGQPTVGELIGMYRLREQRPGWPVYGVIGSPIAHSLSPLIHNAALAHDRAAGVYVPFRVEDPVAFWAACGDWISGLSITIPHKEAWFDIGKQLGWIIEEDAKRAGAANTLYKVQDGLIRVANTDAVAIRGLIESAGSIAGKTLICLGAGGVARAIVYMGLAAGAKVVIVNRTRERAEALARELRPGNDAQDSRLTVMELDQAVLEPFDVLVNGTAIGMKDPLSSPWPAERHRPGSLVFDTVYTPLETRLLREAAAAGARTVRGLDMFIQQAAMQYFRFTGRLAPIAVMRAAALSRLEPKA
jgi:3-dehydroquinate dehydratase/shikimate dehydrogenase